MTCSPADRVRGYNKALISLFNKSFELLTQIYCQPTREIEDRYIDTVRAFRTVLNEPSISIVYIPCILDCMYRGIMLVTGRSYLLLLSTLVLSTCVDTLDPPYNQSNVTGCPEICDCYVFDLSLTIDCNNKNLTQVPDFSNVKVPTAEYSKIETLTLQFNQLTEINEGAFSHFHVRIIKLNFNDISTIDDNAFDGSECESLDLTYNENLIYTENMFKGLGTSLRTLTLDNTGLLEIPSRSLQGLVKLKTFRASHNYITSIAENDLDPIKQLETLSLLNNTISDISKKAVEKLTDKYVALQLDYNQITNVASFYDVCYPTPYSMLSVNHNPIHCDCELYNMTLSDFGSLSGECASPPRYANMSIYWFRYLTEFRKQKNFGKEAHSECGRYPLDFEYSCKCDIWYPRHEESKYLAKCYSQLYSEPSNTGAFSKLSKFGFLTTILIHVYCIL